ncbi:MULTISPECIES: hypothetical protein [unclassified Bacillus (in: firmicutes)]|uniref:hypothetical protein n=1 Tax=unclassified Bacillus (in: firmicutes) TaxID=185979 RepID=UPI0025704D3B|nr:MULTISPECIES: hypothetical protein [unclassified Bacillus (in: firmicutes)]
MNIKVVKNIGMDVNVMVILYFVFRTLADMFPQDYERYMKESIEFKISHTVLCCPNYFYKCVLDDTNVSTVECLSCKTIVDKSKL